MDLNDVKFLDHVRFEDNRGYFEDLFYHETVHDFVIESIKRSYSPTRYTVRGLHFQFPPFAQAKWVRCTSGSIFDVVVDLRVNSSSFGKSKCFLLNNLDCRSLFIPKGFAHGFMTLQNDVEVVYAVDNVYAPDHEGVILWNDVSLKIDWPVMQPMKISDKDSCGMTFDACKSVLENMK